MLCAGRSSVGCCECPGLCLFHSPQQPKREISFSPPTEESAIDLMSLCDHDLPKIMEEKNRTHIQLLLTPVPSKSCILETQGAGKQCLAHGLRQADCVARRRTSDSF
jgi:hypothetical protein